MTLQARLRRGDPVLLDGATGTELGRRGLDTRLPLWSARALTEERGRTILSGLHAEYAAAGAEILTTNTFRTTKRALARAGREERWILLNRRAVEAARAGAARGGGRAPLVAGSIAPLEDCYRPDLVPAQTDALREHLLQADLLARLGVDLLLIETMNCFREARAAVEAARAVGIDFLLSLCPGSPRALLSGEPLGPAAQRLREVAGGRLRGLLLNCAPPGTLARAFDGLAGALPGLPVGVYAHLGEPDPITGWRLPLDQDPEGYASWTLDRVAAGAVLVGGCCGTTPAHIAALARRLGRRLTPQGSGGGRGRSPGGGRPRR